ncbi:MAG TPA: bacillithiol system redox-active protein YtxJ [Gemmatimonadales bacterium]|nr:bacillithiol system redox-active protein YtxJ [Gemmatimonadales bacterium]
MILLRTASLDLLLVSPRLLLLKHSPRCGVSRWALEEVEQLEREGDVGPIAMVDVVADRELSQAVADRIGVRHQSPQLIFLEEGIVRWHISHGAITADAVRHRLSGAPDRV